MLDGGGIMPAPRIEKLKIHHNRIEATVLRSEDPIDIHLAG